jgi:hypothetical protein
LTTWIELARVGVAVILVVSGVEKLRHPHDLAWWPAPLPTGLAALLPVAELAVAGSLLGIGGAVPTIAGAVLFFAFAAVAARSRIRRTGGDCGCLGGALRLDAGWLLVALDVIVGGVLVAAGLRGGGIAPWAVPSATTLVAVAFWGVLAGLTFWVLVYSYSVLRGVRGALG